jgi:alkylhydroperoxidase family enzyme
LEEGQDLGTVERAREQLRDIRAFEAGELARRAESQDAEVFGKRAEKQLANGDIEGAEWSWRTAGALEPENPRWPALIGKLLAEHHTGRRREAAMEYESALALRGSVEEAVPEPVELPPPVVEVQEPVQPPAPLWPYLLAVLSGVLGWVAWKRKGRSGDVGLSVLFQQAPEVGGEVLTVLYSLQHDVIKHNTSVLPALADALEAGERDLALDVASRVLGRDGGKGVLERWNQGMQRIQMLGLSHGITAFSVRADPVLGPMCSAMEGLGKEARRLHRLGAVSPARVREISCVLNETGAPALAALIVELGACPVTGEVVNRIFEAVRSEPAIGASSSRTLVVEGLSQPVRVRIYSRDLDIILSNLLRNALVAVEEQGDRGRIGVSVVSRVEPVTGLDEVVIQVLDTAPMHIGEDDIARQPADRGLGIVREVLARHGGVLRIEKAQGWSKAMAVHLAGGGA